MEEVIIVGSGPAGYSAGIYAARAGLNPLIVSGPLPGGQLINTLEVENWPGGGSGLLGPDLMERMKKHCLDLEVRIETDSIQGVNFDSQPFKLDGENNTYMAKSVILATGASPRMLGLVDEDKYMGRGLSSCATCDGFFFKNQEVLVVGGGNVAAEDSLFLAKIAQKVHLIHRRDELRAEKMLRDRLFSLAEEGKINIIWDTQLIAYKGDDSGISGATLRHKDGEVKDIKAKGIFIAIGHDPNTGFLGDALRMTNGYINLKNNLGPNFTLTSVPGVFAAGDIADYHYRQAITSAGMGAMAALDANMFLQGI